MPISTYSCIPVGDLKKAARNIERAACAEDII